MDGVRHKLPNRVGDAAKEGRLGTFFDLAKEDFRSVSGQVRAAEHCVVGFEYGGSGLAVNCAELIKMLITRMPSCHPCIAGSLETLKALLTLWLRVVKRARSMFLINKN
jgi:hypothetical protein